jgi:ABC-type spermidine/putrescine transport system permease subunit II
MFSVFSYVDLAGSPLALILAHTMLALPFVIVSVSSGLQSMDPRLELAAASLGAGPLRTFLRVSLPLLLPSIATGALLAFVTSWDEVVLALFFTTPAFKTLPTTMWQQINEAVNPSVAAISTAMVVMTSLLCVVALMARKMRAGEGE